ncbi:MAG: MurR/RpiR family transcriptional regulator [Bauldia sp.]|jgi:DNA-binding MurR/RpiR family transcriptional regulator|nr:MurR/RpiR family transcriptional regulator [Bauldia sp.]
MTIAPAPPRNFEALKTMLLANRDTLPPRLIQVAAFALENPDEIALGTAASVAAQASVQPSTLIRFAKRLGYAGFSDLQGVFRSELKSNWPDYRERLARLKEAREGGGPHPLLSGFAESAMVSLERMLSQASEEEIGRAADILAAADVIYLLGMRRAFPVTFYLAYALGKLGIRAVMIDHVAGLAPEQVAEASKRDALVAISFTPYTPMTVELTNRMAARGVPIVALTDSPFSPLSPNATVKFEIPEADFSGFRSLSATFCVAMAIAVATGAKRSNV